MSDDGIKTQVSLRAFEQAAADREPRGTIVAENDATITRMGLDGKMQTIDANVGDKIYKDDVIKTPSNGSVAIALSDKTVLSGGSNSSIDMSRWDISKNTPHPEDNGIKRGSISSISGKVTPPLANPVRWSGPSGGVRG